MKLVEYKHFYPKENVPYIYVSSFIENNETFYYVGSHVPKKPFDSYYGSTRKIWEAKRKQIPIKFEILYIVKKNEDRFLKEGEYIKKFKDLYGDKCINKNLEPWHIHSEKWNNERRQKYNNTCKEKYNVEWAWQAECIKEKIQKRNQERYGANYPMQNKEIVEKMKNTNLKKYGFESASNNEEIKQKIKDSIEQHGGFERRQQLNVESIKKKCNVENISQLQSVKNKKAETFKKKLQNGEPYSGMKPIEVTFPNGDKLEFIGTTVAIDWLIKNGYLKESQRIAAKISICNKLKNGKPYFGMYFKKVN